MQIRINSFSGMRPRVGAKYLNSNEAVLAQDCRIYSGELRPMRDNTSVGSLSKPGPILSLHRFAGTHWFHWNTDVDVVRTLVANDTTERTFWTGDGYPKQTEAGMATSGGGTNYPTNHYALGIPAPPGNPTVSADAHDDESPTETRYYVYTYVSAWGEESAPSPVSNRLVCDTDATVSVTGMSPAPSGPYNITSKRIYRLSSGTDDSDFLFVAEIPVANTSYSDTVEGFNLQEALPTEGWAPPPEGLKGLIALPNGVMAGFLGKDLYLTPNYVPYAYPVEYTVSTEYPIVGLGAFDTNIVVLTESHPYIATGIDPSAVTLAKLDIPQACVSKRSIAPLGTEGVAYASPDGLCVIGPNGFSMPSEEYMTIEEWREYNPPSILGAHHDGAYIGFFDRGGLNGKGALVFDRQNGFRELSSLYHATATFVDHLTDTLYCVMDGAVKSFDTAQSMLYTWRSKLFQTPPVSFSAARVIAADYQGLHLYVYADGTLIDIKEVSGPDAFRLPAPRRAREWQVQLVGTSAVQEVALATSVEELNA